MTTRMDETFATALRAVLVEQVATEGSAPGRPRTWRAAVVGAAALTVVGGGVAFATGLIGLPGTDVVTHLVPAVTLVGQGSATVELGTPPVGTTDVDLRLTCLTAGTFTTAGGTSLQCDESDVGTAGDTMSWELHVTAGFHSTTIHATAGARWRLIGTYSSVSASAWGVNAHGQTYGVANASGTPSLVAVIATNGRSGYVYADQLARAQNQGGQPAPTSPEQAIAGNGHRGFTLSVYASDGETVIGVFVSK
jgi:hypothetical protein